MELVSGWNKVNIIMTHLEVTKLYFTQLKESMSMKEKEDTTTRQVIVKNSSMCRKSRANTSKCRSVQKLQVDITIE